MNLNSEEVLQDYLTSKKCFLLLQLVLLYHLGVALPVHYQQVH